MRGSRRLLVPLAVTAALGFWGMAARPADAASHAPIPVFAHYYIWFQPTSWNRAKRDFPILGRYSSDERDIMRQHIRWAKQAGINGFIVSWKDTPRLTSRLVKLVSVAKSEHFKLMLIYQGLDFERHALPIDQVQRDLTSFADRFAASPVFHVLGPKPLVALSGSWEFTRKQIAQLSALRRRVQLLGTERNVDGYRRIANLVDGDLYYWSSVNPDTYPHYGGKLREMSAAIHARGGLWIAPAAPGFDARLLGKTTVVDRNNGATLRTELKAAFRSNPDMVGVISWNEFSENTYIEPSGRYGGRYLRVLAEYLHATPPKIGNFDSDAPAATDYGYSLPLLFGLVLLAVAGVFILSARRNRGGGRGSGGVGGTSDGGPRGGAPARPTRNGSAEPAAGNGHRLGGRSRRRVDRP